MKHNLAISVTVINELKNTYNLHIYARSIEIVLEADPPSRIQQHTAPKNRVRL